ncbi:HD domain-containing phosphohydrolase [Candidatus Xianfuyuplasma coldseepsis]|uniref:Diguanylate cyclase n=1 Tax=Candidatus Xianfuyuplasma coldseepsis TaxID=2782163 RepID=A0A7L7KUU0_9MOLU|nr:HD domain-containing phosphohydrolase [Xianfuyuplasma coldseepsis]QMS85538.1 diguanylate cyclase [Xianfuyuplasma coldseepsis]
MDESYHKELLDFVDFSIADHELVYDERGNPIDYRYLYVNKMFCDLMGIKQEEIMGKLAYEIFPKIEKTWLNIYHEVVQSGIPKHFTNYTEEVDRYFNIYAVKTGENRFLTSFRDLTSYVKSVDPSMQENLVSTMFVSTETAYFEFDLRNKQFDYSDRLPELVGLESITYQDYVDLFTIHIHPLDQARFQKQMDQLFDGTIDQMASQVRFQNQATKEYVWISYFAFVEERYRNFPIRIRGLVKDIDQEKHQEMQREQADRLFQETRKIANIATFYFHMQEQQFEPSRELDEFFGLESVIDLQQVRDIIHPDDLEDYDYSTNHIRNNPSGMTTNYRIIKNGDFRYVQSSIFAQKDEYGEVSEVFGILRDRTNEELAQQEISFMATHDLLTKLYNRNQFEKYSHQQEIDMDAALMIIDVDGLKLINDAFGHLEGDKLLISLADILRDIFHEEDVYRIGGDEFVIRIPQATTERVHALEKELKVRVSNFRIYGVGFDISSGYSYFREHDSFDETFRQAENIMYRRKLTNRKSRKSTALATILETLHERTEETEAHCQRVSNLAEDLLRSTGRKRDYEIEEIRLVADLHDIGKISISEQLLSKPGRLTEEEYEAIKYHSESGYKIISNIIDNEDIGIAILYHHERYDGRGYPHGLRGDEIPLYSRIISICDAYDAMTTDRVYHKARSKKQALKEIKDNAGTQFDPDLVNQFLTIIKKR